MLPERVLHTVRLGLRSIAAHRLRSTLTTIGIVLGVASVIVMLAVGEAARDKAVRQIEGLGATNIIVRSEKPVEDDKERKQQEILDYGLTLADVERIRSTIPTVQSVTPLREFRKEIRFLNHVLEGRVVGVLPNYLKMNGLKVSRGRFITDLDNERFANVVVLAAETAEKLFPIGDPLGQSVHLAGSHAYTVVGVTEYRSPSAAIGTILSAQEYNRDAYIPFNTDQVRFGKLLMYFRSGMYQMEKLEISQITVSVSKMEYVKETADIIRGLLDQYHTKKDTKVTVPLDLLERAEETQRIFRLVLG